MSFGVAASEAVLLTTLRLCRVGRPSSNDLAPNRLRKRNYDESLALVLNVAYRMQACHLPVFNHVVGGGLELLEWVSCTGGSRHLCFGVPSR